MQPALRPLRTTGKGGGGVLEDASEIRIDQNGDSRERKNYLEHGHHTLRVAAEIWPEFRQSFV